MDRCRICLENNAVRSLRGVTRRIICDLLQLSVNMDDSLPKKICKKCYSIILPAYELKLLAKRSYDILTNEIVKVNKDNVGEKVKVEECVDSDNVSVKDEYIDDNSPGNEFNCEVKIEFVETPNVKKETIPSNNANELENNSNDPKIINPLNSYNSTSINVVSVKDKAVSRRKETKVKKLKGVKKSKIKLVKLPTMCHTCGKQVKDIRIHSKLHDANRERFPCPDCSKIFSTKSGRIQHYNVDHRGKLYYCKICDKFFKRKSCHRRFAHSDRQKEFTCLECNKKFVTKGSLVLHMRTHTQETPYVCHICQKGFRTNSCCKIHIKRVHERERENICQFCSKGFFTVHELKDHLRSHTKEKNFKCKECEKLFSSISSLRDHERKHTGIKTEECKICEMKFWNKRLLGAHMITHTKEKKHECKYCGVKFGRSDHRNRHQKTAHENKIILSKEEKNFMEN